MTKAKTGKSGGRKIGRWSRSPSNKRYKAENRRDKYKLRKIKKQERKEEKQKARKEGAI